MFQNTFRATFVQPARVARGLAGAASVTEDGDSVRAMGPVLLYTLNTDARTPT